MELWHLLVTQGLVLALVGWVLKTIIANGNTLSEIMQWRIDHDQKDNERHQDLQTDLAILSKQIGGIKRGLRGVQGHKGATGLTGARGQKGDKG